MVSLAPHTHYMCAIIQNLKNLSTADISPVSQQDQSTTIGKKKKKEKVTGYSKNHINTRRETLEYSNTHALTDNMDQITFLESVWKMQ